MSGSFSPVAAALIGAGGALIGSAVTSATNVVIEGKRHKRDRGAREARELQELRRAVRLAAAELDQCQVALKAALDSDDWRLLPRDVLPLIAWEAQREVLADHLPNDVWKDVRNAYRYVETLRIGTASAMGNKDVATIPLAAITSAIATLAAHSS